MALEDLIRLHTEALAQNTEAVKALTAALKFDIANIKAGKPETETKVEKSVEKPVKEKDVKQAAKTEAKGVKEEPKGDVAGDPTGDAKDVAYSAVRELVLKLAAAGHREAIKAINTKHGIASLPALLSDKEDFSTVTDQAKLETVYADLLALEA